MPHSEAERTTEIDALLAPDEPAAVLAYRPEGRSPFLLVCDHAGRRIPRRLRNLGLPDSELVRHIAWDPGIAEVTQLMADALDARAIMQPYSRLVIDCNRPPGSPTSIATISETTEIPGNRGLSADDVEARRHEIFLPYHVRISHELDTRIVAALPTILVAMHSFTPVFRTVARPWHAGILYNRDSRLAGRILELLRREDELVVGENEPYTVDDETDYTIPVHGEQRGIEHVALEIRQDLIADEAGRRLWAERMTRVLRRIAGAVGEH